MKITIKEFFSLTGFLWYLLVWLWPYAQYSYPWVFIDDHDIRVLVILLAMMLISSGLKNSGVFSWLTTVTVSKISNKRLQVMMLVLLSAIFSAIAMNDIALLVLVPMVISIFEKDDDVLISLILITLSANLVGAIFPISNPQNMYLYGYYHISFSLFIRATLPIAIGSLVLLSFLVYILIPREVNEADISTIPLNFLSIPYGILLAILLTGVIITNDFLIWISLVGGVLLSLFDIEVWRYVDYMLLLTFISFFIISGFISSHMSVRFSYPLQVYVLSAFLSQMISNVPTATIIADTTPIWKALLYGVTVGGIGTLISSMANVITYRLYMAYTGKKNFLYAFHRFSIPVFLLVLIWGYIVLFI